MVPLHILLAGVVRAFVAVLTGTAAWADAGAASPALSVAVVARAAMVLDVAPREAGV